MNAAEANVLITAAAIDDRFLTPDRDRAKTWARVLRDVRLDDALAALDRFERTSAESVKPAHIFGGVRELLREYRRTAEVHLRSRFRVEFMPYDVPLVDLGRAISTGDAASVSECEATFVDRYTQQNDGAPAARRTEITQ